MADAPVVLVGAGGHARVVTEALLPRGVFGHVSPDPSSEAALGPHLGSDDAIAALAAVGHPFALGLGFVDAAGARRRAGVLDLLGDIGDSELVTVVHAAAAVSPTAAVGAGTFVAAVAVLGAGTRVGRAAIVNTGALIDHDCVLGDNVHVAPGVTLSGGVTVGANTLVGVGATVIQGVTIGSGVVVGAGAVVISDLPDGVTAVGVPARIRG